MAIKKLRPWLLPVVWLLGFLCAWGMILVDRQMIIDSQADLQEELRRTKLQLKVVGAAEEFGDRWQEIVIWNKNNAIGKSVTYSDLSGWPVRQEKMLCPTCGKEGSRSTGFSETVSMPYGDVEAAWWECPDGHRWMKEVPSGQVDK